VYKAAVRWMIRRNIAVLTAGDPGPVLAGYADDAVLVFPGNSTWSGEHRGKPAIESFLRRFLENRLVGEPHDIVVSGPPWKTTVCVLMTVEGTDQEGAVVYANRAILFARAKWGKIFYHEDFEDTHKIEAFDAYIRAHTPADA
jgi:ketosteroid isomerase-like protein